MEWANYSPWGPEELDMIIKPREILRGSNRVLFIFLKADVFTFFLQGSSAVNGGLSILSI